MTGIKKNRLKKEIGLLKSAFTFINLQGYNAIKGGVSLWQAIQGR